MNDADTMKELAAPVRALLALMAEFGHLPAPHVGISPIFPTRLDLSLHDDLGTFEPWRYALGIAHDDVRFATQGGGLTWVLQGAANYAGVDVRLVAYGDVLQPGAAIGPGGRDAS
ncbi:hypothetical protein G3I40_08665 [Streptomyces sp. SID14478]|uniref:hypothetical protein n=1 Tax=Streptomyces sp. SID14478 TaxID=2706073 RepID=UPI0013DC564B|nr:hypothetical protein [Streptomyces sp. SID14478]NEB75302.1 hypothetical protein [Streptomyces sp. SID14478]